MRNVTFSEQVLKRIASIQSLHFSRQETEQFQIKLIEMIYECLSVIAPLEGYREYDRGPWANTRRIVVMGPTRCIMFTTQLKISSG